MKPATINGTPATLERLWITQEPRDGEDGRAPYPGIVTINLRIRTIQMLKVNLSHIEVGFPEGVEGLYEMGATVQTVARDIWVEGGGVQWDLEVAL